GAPLASNLHVAIIARAPGGSTDEIPLVPLDALSVPAGRLQAKVPFGVGRSAGGRALRPGEGSSSLQRLSRPARICRALRIRRHLRQRAPSERLRPDALAQPDGGGAGPAALRSP